MTDVAGRSTAVALDPVTTRIRAANASPMTLTGTNTYVVGDPVGGRVVVVDPGPRTPTHRRAIEAAVDDRAAALVAVVITHHHQDHAEAVVWAEAWDVPAMAFDPDRVVGTRAVAAGDVVAAGEVELVVHHHPGHTSDHVSLHVPDTGVVLTGDHVLGEGTTVIAHPDGDLGAYLASLRALRGLGPSALYPGHGEVITDPAAHVDALLAHREQRTVQIEGAIADGHGTVDEIVRAVYPELRPELHPAASRSVAAHLADLQRRGRAGEREGRWHGA